MPACKKCGSPSFEGRPHNCQPKSAMVDSATIKEEITRLKWEIDEKMRDLHDKVMRIRDDAKHYERDAYDRAYADIEPMRRQMEAMILSVADYESLRAPAPFVLVEK
jgi:hypothetical protein